MEKDRSTKVIAVVALLVGVVGLTIGFAAFSNNLVIQSSAEVTPDQNTFNVDFTSASSGDISTAPIVPTTSSNDVTATNGTINNSGDPTVSGIHATFTAPGQSATYTFYAKNIGEYIAYLKSINFANVTGESSTKVCTPGTGTTANLVTAACNGISMTVQAGSQAATSSSVANIATNNSLAIDGFDTVIVTISYANDAAKADGDFTVAFGDVTLNYQSVN